MSDETLQCSGTNKKGEPCGAPPEWVDEETGLCPAHQPGGDEVMRERASKGGKASQAKRRMESISADELPPLEDHAAAEIWLDVVGRAVVTGRVDNRDAQACIRAVDTFLKARAEKEQSQRIGELRRKMEDLEAELEARRNDKPWE